MTNLWDIDVSHSAIHFYVRHMVISKVHGRFAKWAGTLQLDAQDLTRSSVDVRIDAASIDTQVADRDAHLRSADFLDVAKHPELTFRSKRIDRAGDRYRVVGDLSLHGVVREVTLDAEFAGTNPHTIDEKELSARLAHLVEGVASMAKIDKTAIDAVCFGMAGCDRPEDE